MKTTAVSMFVITALLVASVSGIAAPTKASGGTIAPQSTSSWQSGADLRIANQSGCAKWRQFTSVFSLKPTQSKLNQRPGVAEPDC